jgi:RNA polymerase sigma factor (sigma-70 family)
VKDQSEEDFVDFYRAQWPRLVAALVWSLPEGEDPRDVAQEALARAFERWSVVRSHPRPDGWLFLTAYRLARRVSRRARLAREHRGAVAPSALGDVEADIEVRDLLARISARQRAALIMRHHYGFSTRETAQLIRAKEGTVKSLLARARKTLEAAAVPPEQR